MKNIQFLTTQFMTARFNSYMSVALVCESFDQLSDSIKSQIDLRSSVWVKTIIYKGMNFVVSSVGPNSGIFDVHINNISSVALFRLDREIYSNRYWRNFHKRLQSVFDQMIIHSVHSD